MLKKGNHPIISTNWNFAVELSNESHTPNDTTKFTRLTLSAMVFIRRTFQLGTHITTIAPTSGHRRRKDKKQNIVNAFVEGSNQNQ
jgi:hypothetical protein